MEWRRTKINDGTKIWQAADRFQIELPPIKPLRYVLFERRPNRNDLLYLGTLTSLSEAKNTAESVRLTDYF